MTVGFNLRTYWSQYFPLTNTLHCPIPHLPDTTHIKTHISRLVGFIVRATSTVDSISGPKCLPAVLFNWALLINNTMVTTNRATRNIFKQLNNKSWATKKSGTAVRFGSFGRRENEENWKTFLFPFDVKRFFDSDETTQQRFFLSIQIQNQMSLFFWFTLKGFVIFFLTAFGKIRRVLTMTRLSDFNWWSGNHNKIVKE